MHLYNAEGRIKKYDTPEQIIEEFYPVRLQYYEKRKEAIVAEQIYHLNRLGNKLRFIELAGDGKLVVFRRKREDVIADLIKHGFDAMTNDESGSKSAQSKEKEISSFDYLLAMPISSMTLDDIECLESELKARKAEHQEVLMRTPEEFWEADLTAFLAALEVTLPLMILSSIISAHCQIILGIRAGSRSKNQTKDQEKQVETC